MFMHLRIVAPTTNMYTDHGLAYDSQGVGIPDMYDALGGY